MTDSSDKSASAAARLLRAAGSTSGGDGREVEAVDYPWDVPCRFTAGQLEKIEQFAQVAAGKITDLLHEILRTSVALSPGAITRHYARGLRESDEKVMAYAVAIDSEGLRPCGLVTLSADSATDWVGRLLGTSSDGSTASSPPSGPNDARELSILETDLLRDAASALAKQFSATFVECGGRPFDTAGEVTKGSHRLSAEDSTDYYRIEFVPASGAEPAVSLVMTGDLLEPIVRLAGPDDEAGMSPEQAGEAMLSHVERTGVNAAVRIPAAVTMRDVMAMEPGDVLVLDRKVDDPIDLVLAGQVVLRGFPCQSNGRYALRVQALSRSPADSKAQID